MPLATPRSRKRKGDPTTRGALRKLLRRGPGRPRLDIPSVVMTLRIPAPDIGILSSIHPRPHTAIRLLLRRLSTSHRELVRQLAADTLRLAALEQQGESALARVRNLAASINAKEKSRRGK